MILLTIQLITFLSFTQLSLHFWPEWSYASGLSVDYLSPTIYLTDLFLLLLFFLSNTPFLKATKKNPQLTLIITLLLSLNLIITHSPITYFVWLRLLLLFNFYLHLKLLNKTTQKKLLKTLALSTLIPITIALLQFLTQSSLDGPLYWLGERTLNPNLSNLARLDFCLNTCKKLIRPYATFSHPNSLAGYLLVIYFLTSKKYQTVKKIILLGIIITFSKAALITLLFLHLYPQQKLNTSLVLVITLTFLTYLTGLNANYQFLVERSLLLKSSLTLILKHPLGVGLGAYPAVQSGTLGANLLLSQQPVHNLFLLLTSELGLPILVIFNYLKNIYPSPALLAIIYTGIFDHYWLTLPQNQLLLTLVLALSVKSSHAKS